MRRLVSAPAAARVELGAAAAWIVLGAVAGAAQAGVGGTVGTLWGTTITEQPPALLIGLNVLLAGVLLALPFLVIGSVLLGHSRTRARVGRLLAFGLALLCIGGSVAGTIVELQRSPSPALAFDRAGGAAIVFVLCGVMHAIAGLVGRRSLRQR